MTADEKYMTRCIELAERGAGNVSPNPMVGCVIVKNGKVIAEGCHKKYGTFHAERNAINSALKKGISLKGSELYVNLEPCAHSGKTPPCADLITEHKFKRVIIGIKDPFHLVAGKGIAKIKKHGIKVTVGVLEDECRELNKFFFKLVQTGLPYITIKAAQTIDGKIADLNFKSKWISSAESRRLVHKMRAVYDAVLVGRTTVEYDNPQLNVREAKGRDPYRIVIDADLKLSSSKKIFSDKLRDRTIILASKAANEDKKLELQKKGVKVISCDTMGDNINLSGAFRKLTALGISSILAEGGAYTYKQLIRQKLADEFVIFIAPKIMGKGIEAFDIKTDFKGYKNLNFYKSGRDVLINITK
jgi:diaminohydroxyphosphoribosylaminopyrimidine deaminase / 5-amino-6-(5-phosphoribosylamino)uracil reductase